MDRRPLIPVTIALTASMITILLFLFMTTLFQQQSNEVQRLTPPDEVAHLIPMTQTAEHQRAIAEPLRPESLNEALILEEIETALQSETVKLTMAKAAQVQQHQMEFNKKVAAEKQAKALAAARQKKQREERLKLEREALERQKQESQQQAHAALNDKTVNNDAAVNDAAVERGAGKVDAASASGRGDYQPIFKAKPRYPRQALRRQIEGYVILEYTVTGRGTVTNIEIVESNPSRVFDKAAIDSAKQYRYQPRLVAGKAVAVPGVRTKINFVIR